MFSLSHYLLSGSTASGIGTVLPCLGMDKFSFGVNATSFGSNVATGTIRIEARLDPAQDYIPIYNASFTNNTGFFTSFDGPFESIRAVLNPLTTGTYTAVVRYSSYKS